MELSAIPRDRNGHLIDRKLWTQEVALVMAAEDQINLTDDHWALISAVQDIFEQTGDTPPMRLLIKTLRVQLNDSIDSRFLYRLYPNGPVRFASKHAGLPKPKHCM